MWRELEASYVTESTSANGPAVLDHHGHLFFNGMSETVKVPQAILTGKRLPTAAERELIPDHLLPEFCRAKTTSVEKGTDESVITMPEQTKQCNSCRKTSMEYTQTCAACELYICMGDACCNVADSRVFDCGSGSSGGRYVCNDCDKEQQTKLKRLKDTPAAKTVQQTFKPPLVVKKRPNPVPVSEGSPEEVLSDATVPDPDYNSRMWLEKVREELVIYYICLIFYRVRNTKLLSRGAR